jgi:hypothetical protein
VTRNAPAETRRAAHWYGQPSRRARAQRAPSVRERRRNRRKSRIEVVLIAVLEKHRSLLGPQVLEPACQEANDPTERIFAILNAYRKQLRYTDFRPGCPIENLAPEVCNNHPKVRPLIVENFQAWCGTIEGLIKEASDRLPAKTKPAPLGRHVLATMEGGVMLARVHHNLEPFDQAVNHLKDYFDRLLEDRAESERLAGGDGKATTRAGVPKGVGRLLHRLSGPS